MTIQMLRRLERANETTLPPVIHQAVGLVTRLEVAEGYVPISNAEAAITANRAFLAHQEAARQVAEGHFPNSPDRVEQLMGQAGHVIEALLDQALVCANEGSIKLGMEWVKEEANHGNRKALKALTEVFSADSTGPIRREGNSIGPERFAAFDNQSLQEAKDRPVRIGLPEAEVVLAASVAELEEALQADDRPTIIELGGAVRLIIGHMPDELATQAISDMVPLMPVTTMPE